jgi:hypothetical protein
MKQGAIIATILGVGAIILVALKWDWIKKKIIASDSDTKGIPVPEDKWWNPTAEQKAELEDGNCQNSSLWTYKIDLTDFQDMEVQQMNKQQALAKLKYCLF